MFNLAMTVSEQRRQRPGHLAVVDDRGEVTYEELDDLTARCSAALRAAGLATGDAVGLQMTNGIAFVIAYLGILKAGMVVVPFNVMAVPREAEHILRVSGARAVFTDSQRLSTVLAADPDRHVSLVIVDGLTEHGTEHGTVEDPRVVDLETTLEDAGPQSEAWPASTTFEDPAVIIFTSGTTGTPKGAVLTHGNLWASASVLAQRSEPGPEDVALACLPLFHVYGLSGILNVGLTWGMTLITVSRFQTERVAELVERWQVTRASFVPTMITELVKDGDHGHDLSSLGRVSAGGSSLPVELIEAFERLFPNATLLEGYGASETTSSICVNQDRINRKVGSVGTASWGCRLRIVDDADQPLPPGPEQVGQLQVRGPTVFAGYKNDPEASEAAFCNGWLRTGDMGWLDDEGYLFLTGRRSELIIRGGYNVYPVEVEQVLGRHPQVIEAAVLSVPDDRVGEEIVALVVPSGQLTGEALREYAMRELSGYKYPRHFRFVEELPRTAAGKLRRPALAELFTTTAG